MFISDEQKELIRISAILNAPLADKGFLPVTPEPMEYLSVWSKLSALYDLVIKLSLDKTKNNAINVDVHYLWKGGWLLSPNIKEKTTSYVMFTGQWVNDSVEIGQFKEELIAVIRAILLRKAM
jgi:hypothetical protein